MTTCYCHYFKADKPSLKAPPVPGPLGDYLQEHISQEAWEMWGAQQVKLINEHRLSMARQQDRAFLQKQMRLFFQIPEELG